MVRPGAPGAEGAGAGGEIAAARVRESKVRGQSCKLAMRICMYHHYYLPLFSGAAIRSHQQARLMLEWGHTVWVLTPRYPGLPAREVLDSVPIVRTQVLGRRRMQRFLTFAISAALELVRRREEYDLVHFFALGVFELFPIIVAKVLGKRVLYQMTMMPPGGKPLGGQAAFLIRWTLRMVDGVIVLTTPMRQVLKVAGCQDRPLALIPNGVDTSAFRPVGPLEKAQRRQELGLDPHGKYICFVGTVEERKGVDVLISAFAQVAACYPKARLLIVGRDKFMKPGFERDRGYQRAQAFADRMRQYVQELELGDRVIFTGHASPERVALYLQASDLFLLPSRREGFPSVVVQAMATGLPCVVADLDGVAVDIIASGVDGYIVNGLDPVRYAERLLDLLANPAEAERIGQAARRTAEQRFRIERVVAQYLAFCEELLGNRDAVFGERKEW